MSQLLSNYCEIPRWRLTKAHVVVKRHRSFSNLFFFEISHSRLGQRNCIKKITPVDAAVILSNQKSHCNIFFIYILNVFHLVLPPYFLPFFSNSFFHFCHSFRYYRRYGELYVMSSHVDWTVVPTSKNACAVFVFPFSNPRYFQRE